MDSAIAMTPGAQVGYLSLAIVALAVVASWFLVRWFDAWEQIGQGPLAIEQEPPRDPAPAADDERLRNEVRQLLVARNERRLRQGEQPLDVEAETERQLANLLRSG